MITFDRKKGSINPASVLQPFHTIPVQVRKYYTDVNGIIVDKNTVAAALQTRYPVFLLGEFDRNGAYTTGRKAVSPEPGTYFKVCFTNGNGVDSSSVVGVSGLNEIQGRIKFGDIVLVYTDNILAPTNYVWIVITNNAAPISSILANSQTTQRDKRIGKLFVYEVNYFVDEPEQFKQDLHFTHTDNIGNFSDNQLQPLGIFRSPYDAQDDLVRLVNLYFTVNQYLGINFYMIFECDFFTIDFKIKNVYGSKPV